METLQKLWVGQLEVSDDYLRRLRIELFREFEGHIVTFLDDPRGQEFKLSKFSEAPVVRRLNPVAPLTPFHRGLFYSSRYEYFVLLMAQSSKNRFEDVREDKDTLYKVQVATTEFENVPWKEVPRDFFNDRLIFVDAMVSYLNRATILQTCKTYVNQLLFTLMSKKKPKLNVDKDDKMYLKRETTSSRVNSSQRKAINDIKKPLEIIHGPPGTGKSSTITDLVTSRIDEASRILICTSANKALDSNVTKLAENYGKRIIALGANLEPDSKKFTLLSKINDYPVMKMLREFEILVEKFFFEAKEENKKKKEKKTQNKKEDNNNASQETNLTKLLSSLEECWGRLCPMLESYEFLDISAFERKYEDFVDAIKIFGTTKKNTRHHASKFEEIKSELDNERQLYIISKLRQKLGMEIWKESRYIVCTVSSSFKIQEKFLRLLVDLELEDVQISHVILDEAGAMNEIDILGALMTNASSLVLVGDHLQLPPFSRLHKEDHPTYNISLMQQLIESGFPNFLLNIQYRMHEDNCNLISGLFYKNQLITADIKKGEGKRKTMKFISVEESNEFYNEKYSISNPYEATFVLSEVQKLIDRNIPQDKITVITFYGAQKEEIEKLLLQKRLHKVSVSTVDSMQGKENDHIVISCVRTEKLGFMTDKQRINVSLSRAKQSLTVIGFLGLLITNPTWRNCIQSMENIRAK